MLERMKRDCMKITKPVYLQTSFLLLYFVVLFILVQQFHLYLCDTCKTKHILTNIHILCNDQATYIYVR